MYSQNNDSGTLAVVLLERTEATMEFINIKDRFNGSDSSLVVFF